MLHKALMPGLAVIAMLAGGTAMAADCTLSAPAVAGKKISDQCKACHVFDPEKPSRPTGPNLHEAFGQKAGSRTDFADYSPGITGAATKGVTWTEGNLNEYLTDPKAFLTKANGGEIKHKMFFALKDEQKRQDVITFLKEIKGKNECF